MADWNPETKLTVSGHRETERAIKGVGTAIHGLGASTIRASAGLKALSIGLNVATAGMKVAAAGAGALAGGIAGIGVASVRTLGQMQKLQLQLNTLYGSARGGKQAFNWLREYDKQSPLSIMDMAPLVSSLKSAWFKPSKDLPTILDAVMAYGGGTEEAASVIRALAQSIGVGRINQEELNQLTEALPGFPAISLIRGKYGVPKGKDIANAGIDPRGGWNTILNEMDKRYGGASALGAQMIPGLLSTLESAWQQMQIVIGQTLAPAVLKLVNKLTAMLSDKTVQQGIARLYGLFTAFIDKAKFLEPDTLRRILNFDWLYTLMARGVDAWFDIQRKFIVFQDSLDWGLGKLISGFFDFKSVLLKVGAAMVGSVDGVQAALLELVGKFADITWSGDGDSYRKQATAVRASSMAAGLTAQAGAASSMARAYDPDAILNLLSRSAGMAVGMNDVNLRERGALAGLVDLKKRAAGFANAALGDINVPTGALGRPGTRDEGLATGRSGAMSLMDQIILWGGGERARATRTAMLGGLTGRRAVPEFRIKIDTTGKGKMDAAVAEIAEDVGSKLVAAIFQSPSAVQQLRAALGIA